MFIVIDGIDSSGKATQVACLKDYFESQGKTVKVLDYPRYGQKSAYFVEAYLNGKYGEEVDPKTASMFYALDRFDSLQDIKDSWSQADIIISNRYVSANMIHQAGKISDTQERDRFLDWLEDLEYGILGLPRPDVTVFLHIPLELSFELHKKKEKRAYIEGKVNTDLHESDFLHMQAAYNTANFVAQKYGWITIDCALGGQILSKEEVTQKIIEKLGV